jgi:tRNA(Ile)-lysidine synthase
MFKILGTIPKKVNIALSGGVDSMVMLDFICKGRNPEDVTALYFNHNTEYGGRCEVFLRDFCERKNIELKVGRLTSAIPSGASKEAFWRDARYSFLESESTAPVITAHHLNDVMETWIFSSLHGQSKLIKHQRGIFIRPFLLVEKEEILSWAQRKSVEWLDDPSNHDTKFMRNFIRHELMPKALQVNPGLPKVLRKKLVEEFKINKEIDSI